MMANQNRNPIAVPAIDPMPGSNIPNPLTKKNSITTATIGVRLSTISPGRTEQLRFPREPIQLLEALVLGQLPGL